MRAELKILIVFVILFSPIFIVNAQTLPVHTQTVHLEQLQVNVSTSGLLVNQSEQTLAFKTPGIVAEVRVKEGQRVQKGDILARLDQEEIAAQVREAQAMYDDAVRTVNRLTKLHKSKVVPLDQLQSAETGVDVAKAKLRVANFNLRHATIKAPENGYVLRKLIEPNEIVSGQRAAFVFAQQDAGWVIRVGLNDRDIVRIQEGDLAQVRVDAYPGKVFTGRVYETAAKANPGTGTFEVEVQIDPTEARLLSGMVGRVDLVPSQQEEYVLIPLTAVISASGNQAELFTLDDEFRALRREVTIRNFTGNKLAVTSGLEPGDMIITRGATSVVEGRTVMPVGATAVR